MGSAIKGLVAALACAASFAAQAIATEWTVIDLTPDGPGIANAVSENGNVVGCRNGPAGDTRAFIYSNGQLRDLPAPPGATSCAFAVNNNGVVAGRIDGEITIWDAGSVRGLGVQGGVGGINEAGVIVGWTTQGAYNAGGPTRAIMWSNGVMTDLGSLGGDYNVAIAINELGQVTGNSAGRPFLYENGVMRDIGAASGIANAINDRGEIVGMTGFGHGPETYIYDGSVRPIPGAYSYASAVGINNVGQVVASGEGVYGFLVEGGASARLDVLAGAGWHHIEPKAINDRGWIVGLGGSPDFHAFLMKPKEASMPAGNGNPAARPIPGTRPLLRTRAP